MIGRTLWAGVAAALAFGAAGQQSAFAAEELPPYFSAISFPAQPLPWTAAATADFGALLKKLGEQAPLDPASVRAATAEGLVLPTAFDPDAGAADSGVVRWSVPPMPKEARTAAFKIYFASKSGRKWEAARPDTVPAPNLLPNGGFEQVESGGAKLANWPSSPEMVEVVTDPQKAHSGQRCVKIKPWQNPNSKQWQSYIQTPGKPGVVVEGGKGYSFRFWVRFEGAVSTGGCADAVYWYRADGSYIVHEGLGGGAGSDTGWTEVSKSFQAPPDAHYTMHYPSFYSSKGACYMDDFVIWLTQTPQLESAQNADGSKKVALGVADPNIRRFDFGPDGGPVWPGFAAVTPKTTYTKQTGFGWTGNPRPMANARSLPDDLARTYVIGSGLQFAVDLPDGDYKAWLLIGDSGLGDTIIPTNVSWSVKTDGKEVLGYHPDAKTWYETVVFRNLNDWWTPDADLYERFVAPQYAEKTIPLTAKGGRAVLELNALPLDAMIVYPANLEGAMQDDLARLRAARRRSVAMRYSAPARETPAEVSAADRGRGYVLFAPPNSREIFPGSAPQRGEVVSGIKTSVAPGEMKPITFALYPLREVGDVSVTVSDLKTAGGGVIPAAAVEVAVVRYAETLLDDKEYRYDVAPRAIQPRNPMPVPKDVTVRWWLTLRAPQNAAAGDYAGRISVAPGKAGAAALDLEVKVLPVKLGPTPITAGLYHFDRTYWYIYWMRRCFEDKDGWLRQQALQHERDDMALLKEFGLNALSFCDDNRGMTWDGKQWNLPKDDRFTVWMDLYKEAGMGPMPWYGFCGLSDAYLHIGIYGRKPEQFTPEWENAYRSIIAWTVGTRQIRGWPEILFYVSDELSNEGDKGADRGRRYVQMTKDIPGIRTIASMNGRAERVMLPGLKIAMPNHAFPINNDTVAEIRKNGCEFWIYNCGNSRVMWGFYLWRMGATGRFQWYHRYAINEPWNAFDGDNHYSVTWITPGKPIPSPSLWAIHDGLDDLRYLAALEKSVADARKSGKPGALKAAEDGQKALDGLRDLVPDEARLLTGSMDPREAGKPAVGRLADDNFLNELRAKIADQIAAIDAALR